MGMASIYIYITLRFRVRQNPVNSVPGREAGRLLTLYLLTSCYVYHITLGEARRGEARRRGGTSLWDPLVWLRVSGVLGSYVYICILRCMEKESCASLLTEILVRCIVQKKGGVRGMWLGSRWWVFSKIHEGISSTEGKGAWSRIRF